MIRFKPLPYLLAGVSLLALSVAQAEELPEAIKAVEARGAEVVGTFDAPGGMKGYAARYNGQGMALYLMGKDTLKQLPALLERADLLMTPDSGPMHIANAMGTPVLGLHAASNPERSGPYTTRRYCVNRYDDAARKYRGKPASELKWGTKIEHDGVMDLVTVEDAIAAFERFVTDHAG